ncbi:MAG: hypothetical protein MK008_09225 [Bdellovibrionales bacterium]|nr:hypothetical protein [Bdellovibrionales bacterium]
MRHLNMFFTIFLTTTLFNISLLSANTKRVIHYEQFAFGDVVDTNTCLKNLTPMSEGSLSRAYCDIPTGINRTTYFFATPLYKEISHEISFSENLTCSVAVNPRFRSRSGKMQLDFLINDDNISKDLLDFCVKQTIKELKDTIILIQSESFHKEG